MLNMQNICWHDAEIINIYIEYNKLIMKVKLEDEWNTISNITMECIGFIGINNLCIFDDIIIDDVIIEKIYSETDDFLKKVFNAYNETDEYDGRTLNNGIIKITCKIINNIAFEIYCFEYYLY